MEVEPVEVEELAVQMEEKLKVKKHPFYNYERLCSRKWRIIDRFWRWPNCDKKIWRGWWRRRWWTSL